MAVPGKYVTAYTGGTNIPGFANIGNIAVDDTGAGDYSLANFVGGILNSYDTNGYVIISDTTTAGVVGRATGGDTTGPAPANTPTFWVSVTKDEQGFLDLVNRLPARNGQVPFTLGSDALTWLNNNGYWSSWVSANQLLMYLDSTVTNAIVGSTFIDSSANSADATIVGSVVQKKYNDYNVLKLEGGSHIESQSFATHLDTGFTFDVWVSSDTTSNGTLIVEWGGPIPNGWTDAQMAFVTGHINNGVYFGGYIQGPLFTANKWYNIVSTYDDVTSTLKLYIDGVFIDSQNISKANSGDTFLSLGLDDGAGVYIGGANGNFQGLVGVWRVYDYPIDNTVISSNYDNYRVIFDNSLVLNVDASNSDSYPGSGGTWYDLSLKSHNGTISSATFNSGINGGTFVFNGTSANVSIGQPIPTGSSYSISAWVYANNVSQAHNIVSSTDSPFWVNAGTLYAGVGSNYMAVSSGSFPTNTWKFVSMTFNTDTNTMKLYINGSLVNTNNSVTQNYTAQNTYIGSHFTTTPVSFWNGNIAYVSIYTSEQTATQITNSFNNTKTRFGL